MAAVRTHGRLSDVLCFVIAEFVKHSLLRCDLFSSVSLRLLAGRLRPFFFLPPFLPRLHPPDPPTNTSVVALMTLEPNCISRWMAGEASYVLQTGERPVVIRLLILNPNSRLMLRNRERCQLEAWLCAAERERETLVSWCPETTNMSNERLSSALFYGSSVVYVYPVTLWFCISHLLYNG
jgi:hypothetical protein